MNLPCAWCGHPLWKHEPTGNWEVMNCPYCPAEKCVQKKRKRK